jgi:hypothetical protein
MMVDALHSALPSSVVQASSTHFVFINFSMSWCDLAPLEKPNTNTMISTWFLRFPGLTVSPNGLTGFEEPWPFFQGWKGPCLTALVSALRSANFLSAFLLFIGYRGVCPFWFILRLPFPWAHPYSTAFPVEDACRWTSQQWCCGRAQSHHHAAPNWT